LVHEILYLPVRIISTAILEHIDTPINSFFPIMVYTVY
jgi:hypothetical protein